MALAFVAFVALGMPDGLLGVAWPSVRASFALPVDALGLLLLAGVAGYLTSSLFSGPIVARLGVGQVLAASCALTGIGLLGYSLAPFWWLMVLLGVLVGLGGGAIDASLNAFVAAHFSERVMQWLHASYGIGITLGPIIMTNALTVMNSWRAGYTMVGLFQWALAIGFFLTMSVWNRIDTTHAVDETKPLTLFKTPFRSTLSCPHVWWSTLLFFLYTGAEVTIGGWSYTLLVESRAMDSQVAGFCVAGYWATFTAGRFLAGFFAKPWGVHRLVFFSLPAALLCAMLLGWNLHPGVNGLAVVCIGFAVAPIFAALMSGTSDRVGRRHAANTIGLQMAAGSLGAAFIPSMVGMLARRISLEIIPVCLIGLLAGLLGLYFLTLTRIRSV